jgi:glycosyltransferase involved in cell wall biosynthesis
MVNNLKFSIIVLTHSGDDTLYQCLYSIKNQTFKKFKCIVIGYDTTDACQTIARTICKQDNRFSYIPITGKSLCYAKNLAVSLACNDYTMFIQDNDFLQQDCFEKAVFFIRKYNPQILWTASIQYTLDNYQSNINTHINGIYTAADMPLAFVERCYIYDKIYRTSLLKNIRFIETEQEQVSNIMFNHDCLLQAKSVVNINYRLMHHYSVENECNINDESKTQLTQYIDKINDDNVKKSIGLIIQYNFNDKLNNDLKLDNTQLKVALCAIAKNENLYIREWVEWYKNLGISKIFLYDNNDIDGEYFEDVINDYIESGFVKVIDVRGVEKGCVYDEEGINLQPKCYIEFYEGEGKNYDWICFFDIDEFLIFKKNWNLFNFLNRDKFINTDLILVSWQHYDDNNLVYYDNRPVMERFTHECKWYRHGVKSIVRTNKNINDKYQGNLIHIFRLKNNRTNYSNGIEIRDLKTWYVISHGNHISAPCVLNHYKTKTAQEYIKRHLGRHWGTGKNYTNHAKNIDDCIKDFFKYNEETNEKLNLFKKYSFDTEYIKNELIKYGKNIHCPINLDNPITIQDKINWLKVYDSTELKSKCADKILIHNYCKEKLKKDICIPIINIYNNAYELLQNWDNIPNYCVIKTNHGSGFMIVIKDKSKYNKYDIYNKFKKWLMIDFGLDHYGYQIHYSNIKRKILVEPLMSGINNDKLLKNYKIHCFNGNPKIIEIYTSDGPSNDTRERINFYDLNFKLLNISQYHHERDENRKDAIPVNYNEMIKYSKLLSKDFKFVRVDFYEIENILYLGELTFTPNNGFIKYINDDKWQTSKYLGNLLKLT